MNKKGFTLIELLATIIILSLLMIVAVPNVMSTIDKNKKATYVEDAKKMITLAEYKVRSSNISLPVDGQGIIITLGALDLSDFTEGPEGGSYNLNSSFVLITKQGSKYIYSATIVEEYDEDSKRGLNIITRSDLNKENAKNQVKNDEELTIYDMVSVGSVINGHYIINVINN